MATHGRDSTVLLSDEAAAPDLAAKLEAAGSGVACYADMAELVRERPLSTVEVLILNFRPQPKGTLLAALGRLNNEYPGMQKVAVIDETVPLPIAEYLTSCGVDFLWSRGLEENGDLLAGVVDDMYERTRWLV